MIVGIKIENGSCDPDHAHFKGFFVSMMGLDIAYLCIKFAHYSFSRL